MRSLVGILGTAACVFTLAACNGNGNGSLLAGSAGASPSLGTFRNATVFFFQADGSTAVGSADVGEDGSVEVDTGSYSGPVILEVRGDDDAEYFDEASGQFEDFAAGNSLFAMAPATGSTVAITPLTDAAYRAAVRNSLLPLSAQEVNELNQVVSDALAGGIDILTPPSVVNTAMSMDLPASDAGRYALVLATLAFLGSDGTNDAVGIPPAVAVLGALIEDLADGTLDNMNDGTPISPAYSDFAAEFSAALANAAGAYAGSDLNDEVSNGDEDYENPQTDLTALNEVEDSGGETGGGNNGGGNGGANTTVDSGGLQDLGSGDSVTGTLNGTQRTINFIVNGSEGIGSTISIFAQGMPPSSNFQWQLNAISNQTGVQTCEEDGVIIQFTDSGTSNAFIASGDDGSCQLELTQVADPNGDTTIEGVFTGTLVAGDSNSDTASRTLTRGAFRAQVNFQ